jgi:hypothetical protein
MTIRSVSFISKPDCFRKQFSYHGGSRFRSLMQLEIGGTRSAIHHRRRTGQLTIPNLRLYNENGIALILASGANKTQVPRWPHHTKLRRRISGVAVILQDSPVNSYWDQPYSLLSTAGYSTWIASLTYHCTPFCGWLTFCTSPVSSCSGAPCLF